MRKINNNVEYMHDILYQLYSGKNTRRKTFNNLNIRYSTFKRYLAKLMLYGLVKERKATVKELRIDKRSRRYIEITDKGRMFLSEIKKLDKKYDGILLGERT